MPTFWETPDAELLKQLLTKTTQPWPYWFMHQLNALIPMTGVESVIVRQTKDIIEVLLTKRDNDDINWPGQYHVPGSTLRDPDIPFGTDPNIIHWDVLRRVWSSELQLTDDQMRCIIAKKIDAVPWRHARGGCESVIFLCRADGIEFPVGQFFPAHALPQPFLGGQEIVVNTALAFLNKHPDFFCSGLPD